MMIRAFITFMTLTTFAFTAVAKPLSYNNISSHPRLLMTSGQEKQIANLLKDGENTYLCTANELIFSFAETLFDKPCVTWPEKGSSLAKSREAEKRILYLAYAYRITGEIRYAKRAEEEMLHASKCFNWDPDFWLATAETMTALSIGYDWLFDCLAKSSKDIIADALINKGLNSAKGQKWYNIEYNWNQVCNSAVVGTALALYELIPEEAQRYIAKSLESIQRGASVYGPDGIYPEGYGYWYYGTAFQVLMIEYVRTALGQEIGIEKYPGFLKSAEFIQMMLTPSNKAYGFYDSTVEQRMIPLIFWFARECKDNTLCWSTCDMLGQERAKTLSLNELDRFLSCAMIYAAELDLNQMTKPRRTTFYGQGDTPLYVYRSGWDSPMDTYLGVKGGVPTNNHAHMDNGSFIYEQNGIQWVTDLGAQGYGVGYKYNISIWDFAQNSQRWGLYRISNRSHSTLIIDDCNHNVNGKAEIFELISENGAKGCEVDMGPTLSPYVKSATRTFVLNSNDSELEIKDILTAENGSDHILTWNLITRAHPRIESDSSIILSKKGHSMRLEIISKDKVTPMVESANTDKPYDSPNYGASRVGFKLNLPAGETCEIKVKLTTLE